MNRTVFMLIMFVSASHAQWSTSTIAESTLYVCPGFYPGIVTFDDGGSIVLGALDSYIFARKLDPYGYYQWPPVQVHYHDSSFITETIAIGDWGGWISDADGGVILFWYDHRGSYRGTFGFENNGIYVQRVDRFGVPLWTPGGILVKGPQTGRKKAGIVNDGQGGCIIAWSESEFGFPGAQNKERTRIQRVSNTGSILWERILDSTNIQYNLEYRNIVRATNRAFFLSTNGARILLLDGTVVTDSPVGGLGLLIAEKDSVLYNAINVTPDTIVQTKLSATLDTIWAAFSSGGSGSTTVLFNPAIPDGSGGVYYLRSRSDNGIYVRVRRVDSRGEVWSSELIVQNTSIPTGGYDGHGGVLIGGRNAQVWRFDSLANPVWPTNHVTMLTDPANAYFPMFGADSNGGMIMVFWTTRGGIFAHHSGRNGQIGVITAVGESYSLPESIVLSQNYPNPFNISTTVRFSVPSPARVCLEVFDILGRRLFTSPDRMLPAGDHNVVLDASRWSSGAYFYFLRVNGSMISTKRMLLVK